MIYLIIIGGFRPRFNRSSQTVMEYTILGLLFVVFYYCLWNLHSLIYSLLIHVKFSLYTVVPNVTM